MEQTPEEDGQDTVVRDSYSPDQDRSLTDAVLDAIEDCKGEGLLRSDFDLFEDINPDALDSLFRHDAQPRTRVSFSTDGVRIELWRDGEIEISVEDWTVEEQ